MKIEKNKVVALSYQLEVEGAIADQATADKPLEYIHGTGMLLPKFEAAVEGKEPGESYEFTLSPEDGYGEYRQDYCIDLPKTSFMIDGKVQDELLRIGRVIPMYNSDGNLIQGTVLEVAADTVKMDFNHPMAGKTLHFTGKVEAVRDASEKELECGNCHGGCHGGCHEEGGCHNEGGCKEKKSGCKEKKGGCKGGCKNK